MSGLSLKTGSLSTPKFETLEPVSIHSFPLIYLTNHPLLSYFFNDLSHTLPVLFLQSRHCLRQEVLSDS